MRAMLRGTWQMKCNKTPAKHPKIIVYSNSWLASCITIPLQPQDKTTWHLLFFHRRFQCLPGCLILLSAPRGRSPPELWSLGQTAGKLFSVRERQTEQPPHTGRPVTLPTPPWQWHRVDFFSLCPWHCLGTGLSVPSRRKARPLTWCWLNSDGNAP